MKTISIRLEDNVFKKIEKLRGSKSKSEFYRKLTEDSLNKGEYTDIHSEYEALKNELQHREAIAKIQSDRIEDLQRQIGFLQLEYQKLTERIPKLPEPKKWWQVWK